MEQVSYANKDTTDYGNLSIIEKARDAAVKASTEHSTLDDKLRRILAEIRVASQNGEWSITVTNLDSELYEALVPYFTIVDIFEYPQSGHIYRKQTGRTKISWRKK